MNVLQYLLDALSLGGLYAMAALGVGLLFGVMRLINFAFGDYITWGAYALVIPSTAQIATPYIGGWPSGPLVFAIIVIVGAIALLTNRLAFRPLRSAEPATLLIASFAVSYLLQNLILLVYSGRPKSIDLWHQLTVPVDLGGSQVPLVDLLTILVCLASLALLAAFLKFTRTGMEIRAASENLRMATLLGIRTNRIIAVSFAIVGVLAAITALILVVKTGRLDYRLGVPLTISGFMATAIGGMGSLSGPVLGGFLLGAVTVFLLFALPEELRDMRQTLVFAVVLVLLVCLPGGLVRSRGGEERV